MAEMDKKMDTLIGGSWATTVMGNHVRFEVQVLET